MRLIFVFSVCFSSLVLKAQEPKLMLPIGHTSYLKSIKISPEGKKAITVGQDKKIIFWDIETGFRLADLQNDNREVDDIVFNKKGTRILGILKYVNEKSIPFWNAKTGELITQFKHKDNITYAEYSPDQQTVITASYDGLVKIWDSNSGNILDSLPVNTLIFKAIYSPDGKQIVTADGRSIIIWDLIKKTPLFTLDGHTQIVNDIIFSPDQSKILSTSYDHTAKLWDAKTGKLVYTLNLNDNLEAYFNVTGTAIITKVSGLYHKNIKLWDANSGNLIQTLSGDNDDPRFAIFSHDGKTLALGLNTEEVKILDVKTGNTLYSLKEHYGGAKSALFTPGDLKLAVGTGSVNTKFWDLTTRTLIADFKGDRNGGLTMAMTPDGKKLLTTMGNLAQVWDLEKNILHNQLKGATTNAVEKIEFLDDKKYLITDNATGGFTRIWNVENGDMIGGQMYAQNEIERIIYGKNYNKALVRYKDSKTNEIWDLHKGVLISTLDKKYSSYQNRWAFTPDETKLATASASGNLINIWDTATGELIRQIDRKNNNVTINHLLITPDNNKLLCIDNESNAIVWDLSTGNETAKISNMSGKSFHNFAFIGNKNWFLTSDKGNAKIWDINTGELVMNLGGVKESIRLWNISGDNKRLLTAEFYQENAKLWNLETKRLIAELPGAKREIGKMLVSPDWKYIVTSSSFGPKINVFNGVDGTLIHSIDAHKVSTSNIILASETNSLFSYGSDEIKQWDLATGSLSKNYEWKKKYPSSFAYDAENKQLLVGASNGEIRLWNTETGSVLNDFTGHTGYVNVVKFGPKKNTIISSAEDQTVKIWNIKNGKSMSTFFPVGDADFLNKVNYGYYKSSPGASKLLHYVSNDLQPISFDQLDVKYNRPDKVLQEMGSVDTSLIIAYHKAYLKRIKKLGIDTSVFKVSFGLPTLDFLNRDQLKFEQKENLLSLHLKAKDSTNLINQFNVWVNESSIYGLRGINLKSKKTKVLDTTIVIKLNDGNNRIDASITNENGIESYRIPISVNYTPETTSSAKLHFIGIGINQFLQKENNLAWSVKDVRDLANAMKLKYGDKIIIDTLFDQQVTVSNVIALKSKLKQTSVNDKVIITYSGHGLLNKDFDYYLSTFDVDFSKPEVKGLAYDALEDLLDNIPARKKLLLIDACHSGELDKDELLKINNAEQSLAKNNTQGGKGIKVINTGSKKGGMKTSLELMQQLFVNVSRSTGATIISAAAGTQFALEKNDLRNGVFSYSILEYMQTNTHATVSDLKKYVNKRVVELTAGLQVPTTRNETKNLNWEVW